VSVVFGLLAFSAVTAAIIRAAMTLSTRLSSQGPLSASDKAFHVIAFLVRVLLFFFGVYLYSMWVLFLIVPVLVIVSAFQFLGVFVSALLHADPSPLRRGSPALSPFVTDGLRDTFQRYRSLYAWLIGVK
jgi:hypothetical protein